MQTDHPTTELFFVFALTFCKLKVYKTEENFARRILGASKLEMLTGKENGSWQEVDTRILMYLFGCYIDSKRVRPGDPRTKRCSRLQALHA